MALVETIDMPLGYEAPEFELPDTITGENVRLSDITDHKGLVIMFICNHCPYVKHVVQGIVELANDYKSRGIEFIAISVNDIDKYPEDSPEKMKEWATLYGFTFPYLYDESQQSAKDYFASCTPDFSVFNAENKCVYRGQLDDSRPGNNIPVTGLDIRMALDNLLHGFEVNKVQKPSIGCSIKWKS